MCSDGMKLPKRDADRATRSRIPSVRRSTARSGSLVPVVVLAISLAALIVPEGAEAKVFASQNQALREAFPEATRIERDSRIIGKRDLAQIAKITNADDLARVVVLHTAWRDDEVLGYAHIDVHNVRTKPEAFMVVLTPSGTVRSVRVLAFHEPLDYLPTDRWYSQFAGKTRKDRLRVGNDVHGVVGATLSTRAAAEGVKRMLAYYEVLIRSELSAVRVAPEGESATP